MSTHDCIRLARILTFVRRHDHPEAHIDTTLPDGPAVVWSSQWLDTNTGAVGHDVTVARTMSDARCELGY